MGGWGLAKYVFDQFFRQTEKILVPDVLAVADPGFQQTGGGGNTYL